MTHDTLALLDRHLEAENAHDLDALLTTLTPDCLLEDRALGRRWTGHAGAAEHYRMWWEAFDVVVSGERLHLTPSGAAVVAGERFFWDRLGLLDQIGGCR